MEITPLTLQPGFRANTPFHVKAVPVVRAEKPSDLEANSHKDSLIYGEAQ